ncbi:MAG: sugar ABC transporter permease [Oscillospiraceae bacterium]|nr:sugar ABC transporter permease [Oscillospiraceae bacterium]
MKKRKKPSRKERDAHLTAAEQREKRRERLVSLAFISPSLLGVLIFFVLPFFLVIYYAFVNNPVLHEFVGFDNFRNLFQNQSFRLAAKNTAIFSLISVPSAVIGSLLLACMLSQKIPLRSQIRTFMLSPLMVPVASIVLIWQVVFSNNGALNDFLAHFGVEKIDWMKSEFNRYVVILLFLWKNIGYDMILFLAALANVPTDIQEMAMLEGASSVRIFFQIKLRYIFPTILFVTILSLINSMKIFREVYLLTGKYPYDGLYLLQHFMNNTFESMDYQKLSSAALVMAAVMVLVIGLLFLVDNKLGKDVEEE